MPALPTGSGLDAHIAIDLLPAWLGAVWTAIFLLIAASHLRHTANNCGQRRAWHLCHVLMAIGMAFMYAPSAIDPLHVPAGFWGLVFAAAGLVAVVWALGGIAPVPTLIWLLTSIDLGVMIYMWSGSAQTTAAPVTWFLVVYLVASAATWMLDLYRRLDGAAPIFSLQILAGQPNASIAITNSARESASLLGELDINASMMAMALGMAYMLAAMQVAV
jgi:hypothetical protein